MDQIFAKVPDVDGFFFTTHILAIEAFKYFINHKIDYNNKFKLACIHEEPLFPIISPQINVAVMPVLKIGESIVEIISKQINQKYSNSENDVKNLAEELVLPCECIYRD